MKAHSNDAKQWGCVDPTGGAGSRLRPWPAVVFFGQKEKKKLGPVLGLTVGDTPYGGMMDHKGIQMGSLFGPRIQTQA